jgi:hypothetical protein
MVIKWSPKLDTVIKGEIWEFYSTHGAGQHSMRITSRKVTQALNRAAHYTALLKSRDFG